MVLKRKITYKKDDRNKALLKENDTEIKIHRSNNKTDTYTNINKKKKKMSNKITFLHARYLALQNKMFQKSSLKKKSSDKQKNY